MLCVGQSSSWKLNIHTDTKWVNVVLENNVGSVSVVVVQAETIILTELEK